MAGPVFFAATPLVTAPAIAADQKAVLITGASTGIGRNMAETFAGKGYRAASAATNW